MYHWPYAARTFSGPFLLQIFGFGFKKAQNTGKQQKKLRNCPLSNARCPALFL